MLLMMSFIDDHLRFVEEFEGLHGDSLATLNSISQIVLCHDCCFFKILLFDRTINLIILLIDKLIVGVKELRAKS